MRVLRVATTLIALWSPRSEAQVPSTATPLLPPFTVDCSAPPVLDVLTVRYNQGDWQAFQREARTLLDALRNGSTPAPVGASTSVVAGCTTPTPLPAATKSAVNYETHYVALNWIGADALGQTQLLRAIVHWPEPVPYDADLPGISRLTDVFLAGTAQARSASLYISTEEKDPLADQLFPFAQALFGPLSTTVAGILGGVKGGLGVRSFASAPSAPNLTVTVSGVVLPVARASVRLQMRARDLVRSEDFTRIVEQLGTSLRFNSGGRSELARTQIAKLVDDLPQVASTSCAASAKSSPAPSACQDALERVINQAYDAAMEGRPSDADAAAIEAVDTQFRQLAADALSSSAALDLTFKNRPLTHFAFGAGSAVMGYTRVNRARTKIDDDGGTLLSDPLPRVMTMAFVNWSPHGYDDVTPSITAQERIRPFLGVSLTPDFGVVGGANLLLQRGVGVVAGVGVLFGKGANAEEIGQPPAASEDPFKLAVGRTFFVGISYNYK